MLYQPKRIKAGVYQVGNYMIMRDPTGGNHDGGWGYTSWYVFDDANEPDLNKPMWIRGHFQWFTKRDALDALLGHIAANTPKTITPELTQGQAALVSALLNDAIASNRWGDKAKGSFHKILKKLNI